MITDGKPFDSNVFFSGGAGLFIQYHDIIKPIYLYTIVKMLLTKTSFGLPLEIIENMSVFSLIEWYVKRRYINPLKSLDYAHILDHKELDDLMLNIIKTDESIYRLSPPLLIKQLLGGYRRHHMTFPIYVYSENYEEYILDDCKKLFTGISIKYIYGDLKEAISKCDQNFTYILSDIELVKKLADILLGTCSHVLLSREYRYNYIDNCNTFKYDLTEIAKSHPYIRVGITNSMNLNQLALSFKNITCDGGIDNASNQ